VAAELFQAIVSSNLQPGERIYEENVAHRLGVAKTALREALQNLENRGLITRYERCGSFVMKLMPKDY
jgi:GntR family transcriptional repressor for pyruvate dehydrogenase complex